MSTELMPFSYGETAVRVVMIDGEPEFVLADLCKVLSLSNPTVVAQRIDSDALRQAYPIADSRGRIQNATLVNEAGMYEVVIRSDKPEAVAFRRWITGTVLPEIRRTGGFNTTPALPDRRALAQMVIEAEDRADREAAARVEAESQVRELTPTAAAYRELVDAAGDYAVDDAAKVLNRDPAITTGERKLYQFMSGLGWVFKRDGRWKAYQTQINNGRLAEKPGRPFWHAGREEFVNGDPTVRITPKGLAELHRRLGGTGQLALVAAS